MRLKQLDSKVSKSSFEFLFLEEARKYRSSTKDLLLKPQRKQKNSQDKLSDKIAKIEASLSEIAHKTNTDSIKNDMERQELRSEVALKLEENKQTIEEFKAILGKMTQVLDKLSPSPSKMWCFKQLFPSERLF